MWFLSWLNHMHYFFLPQILWPLHTPYLGSSIATCLFWGTSFRITIQRTGKGWRLINLDKPFQVVAVSLSSDSDYSPPPGDLAAFSAACCATFTFCPDDRDRNVGCDLWVSLGFQQKFHVWLSVKPTLSVEANRVVETSIIMYLEWIFKYYFLLLSISGFSIQNLFLFAHFC